MRGISFVYDLCFDLRTIAWLLSKIVLLPTNLPTFFFFLTLHKVTDFEPGQN